MRVIFDACPPNRGPMLVYLSRYTIEIVTNIKIDSSPDKVKILKIIKGYFLPLNALSCHSIASSSDQIRLILVRDANSGLPVWYDIIPGNVLDIDTIMNVTADVAENLDIQIESLVLGVAYVSEELIQAVHIGSEKT